MADLRLRTTRETLFAGELDPVPPREEVIFLSNGHIGRTRWGGARGHRPSARNRLHPDFVRLTSVDPRMVECFGGPAMATHCSLLPSTTVWVCMEVRWGAPGGPTRW